MKVVVGKKSIA
jgi:hypothetical protein